MRTLPYTPSVEVYAATDDSYLDLTTDVTSCTVSLKQDGSSTFEIKLMNEGGKYNSVFEPMDRIVVFANKGEERNRLITGYINKVSAFTLHPSDFSIGGYDTIGLLQRLYWDPYLPESVDLLRRSTEQTGMSSGYLGQVFALFENVAKWPSSMVLIEREIPSDALELAKAMYLSQARETSEVEDMSDAFYETLRTSGPNIGVAGSIDSYTGAGALLSGNGGTMAGVALGEYQSGVSDGTMHSGGRKYWTWFGWSSRNEWCAVFVSWCANQCGYLKSGVLPQTAAAQGFLDWARSNKDKAVIHHDTSYKPRPGDIVMWDWNQNGIMDHVGIVVENTGGTSYRTVEGNALDSVRSNAKTNDQYTYFVTPAYPSRGHGDGTKEV
jgi:hypothetical protein